ncbi:hypothetical protein R5R35_012310 [Gryllus longicercus]|uniref:aralkylamine N-acetyltransferase n=1 Tax=Gryllus longicercus TaxID=2509291 RepID=A0AAN9YUD0_9ORTH
MAGRDFELVFLRQEDAPRLLAFLKRFFFRDEPLNVAVQLLGPRHDQPCVPLEEYCAEALQEPLSIAAVAPGSGELLGVCLNGSNAPGHADEARARAAACPHPRFRKILRLLAEVEAQADLFARFPGLQRLLEVRVLSVDGACRGLGIGTALLRRTRELAAEHGFPLVRCDCTSAFSARAVDRLGFYPVCTLPYDSYLGDDGRPVFQPEPPHTQVSCYVYKV